MSETNAMGAASLLRTAGLFASEVVLPGGSNIFTGNVATGIRYAAAGLFAKAVIGFPALVLVSTSSFSKATTGHHLTDLLGLAKVGAGDAEARIAELNAKIQALEAKLEAATGASGAQE
ncbi:MAG: DUF6072 family protein [Acidimicrobiales bacterium]